MSDEARGGEDNPGVVAPPPLIYAVTLAAGLLANRFYPLGLFLPRKLGRVLGLALVAGGLLVGISGLRELRRAGTNVDPYQPSTAIVETGPYRYTRNPPYVGMTLTYSGVSAFVNALPPVLLLPLTLTVMRRGVIEREERYLEGKFGDEYRAYKARVRRWV